MKLTADFDLSEFVPEGVPSRDIPAMVIENLLDLATTLLQPARDALGVAIRIGSGWRPADKNAAVGGASASDHLEGRAADLQADALAERTWEEMTFELFDWLRVHRMGFFGQLILEDHREALEKPEKLWVHVSLRTAKHPGLADPNLVLVSNAPKQYRPWMPEHEALA